ncbi:MAG: hypothetical protein HYY84_08485 [Deltaproteobacteria bacterium]|nr:hypothetical protein [Deltaproteobacteria bacterium]
MTRMMLAGFVGACFMVGAVGYGPEGDVRLGVSDASAKSLKKKLKKAARKVETAVKKNLPAPIRMVVDKKFLQEKVEKEIEKRMPEIEKMVETTADLQVAGETEKGVESQISSASEVVRAEADALNQTVRAMEQKALAVTNVAANFKEVLLATAMSKLQTVRLIVTTTVKALMKKALDQVFDKTVSRTFHSIRSPLEAKITGLVTSALASVTAGFGAAAAPLIKTAIARGFDKVQAKLLVRFRGKIEKKMERFVDKMADKAMARVQSTIQKRVDAIWSRLVAKTGQRRG